MKFVYNAGQISINFNLYLSFLWMSSLKEGTGIEALDILGIGQFLTTWIRGDHFCDGQLLGVMNR